MRDRGEAKPIGDNILLSHFKPSTTRMRNPYWLAWVPNAFSYTQPLLLCILSFIWSPRPLDLSLDTLLSVCLSVCCSVACCLLWVVVTCLLACFLPFFCPVQALVLYKTVLKWMMYLSSRGAPSWEVLAISYISGGVLALCYYSCLYSLPFRGSTCCFVSYLCYLSSCS